MIHSFSQLIPTITTLLGEPIGDNPLDMVPSYQANTVVFLLLDAFGYHIQEQFCPGFLERYMKLYPMRSLFPSTTAAHITYLNTGLIPSQTGVYEWFYYEPLIDEIFSPLTFSTGQRFLKDNALKKGIDPKEFFPFDTIYSKLKTVDSTIIQPRRIINSTYTKTLTQGATVLGYETLEDGLDCCLNLLQEPSEKKRYIVLYYSEIDSIGHHKGLSSPEYAQTIEHTLKTIFNGFYQKLMSIPKTAFILTADHGMVPVSPDNTFYVNKEIPELLPLLQKNRAGNFKSPCGSCRDLFLHVLPEKLDEAVFLLTQKLQGKADVFLTSTLLDQGLFGSIPPTKRFLDRMGNVAILPYKNEAVFWYEKNRFEQDFHAAHGGITPDEMDTLFCLSLSEAQEDLQ